MNLGFSYPKIIHPYHFPSVVKCSSSNLDVHGWMDAYKKSKSHDEDVLSLKEKSSGIGTKPFRRSFSQGNIFDRIGIVNGGKLMHKCDRNQTDNEYNRIRLGICDETSISPIYTSQSIQRLSAASFPGDSNTQSKTGRKSPKPSTPISGLYFWWKVFVTATNVHFSFKIFRQYT